MDFLSLRKVKPIALIFPLLSIILILSVISINAFLVGEITRTDVSESAIVPEKYENLLVLDFTIRPPVELRKDIFLHNGQSGSSAGDILSAFAQTDWYSDQNRNSRFDGNQLADDNEATISSSDDILDADDFVKNTGLAFIKPFRYANGIYERYIDSDHSNSYTYNEAIIRSSTTDNKINQGEVILNGSADMTAFSDYIKFTDGIQGNQTPAEYQDGEAVIVDAMPYNILSDADTILTPGKADLKAFPPNILYVDADNDGRYRSEEAVIMDKGTAGRLDPFDAIINDGFANLKQFGIKDRFADSNANNLFDSGELLLRDTNNDGKVQPDDIMLSGSANLRSLSGEGLYFSDSNQNSAFDTDEMMIRNSGDANILESTDAIIRSGKANLKTFQNGMERFIDDNNNDIYDDGECIINNPDDIIGQNDIEKSGVAWLTSFSDKGYLFTDANADTAYSHGEAIFKDKNNNNMIDNGELITQGYAPIRNFPDPLWFIDANKNGSYDIGESAIISADNRLTTDDSVVVAGSAFLSTFPQGIIKWSEVNNNDIYDDEEMIISSPDNILDSGEIIKSGLCGMIPFPSEYANYFYSDNNNNGRYSSDELVIASTDDRLDNGDSVIKAGKTNLLRFRDTFLLFIDSNGSNTFGQNDAIINNSNPAPDTTFLDSGDEVVKSGEINIKAFGNDITYVDVNNDGYLQSDADGDVIWNKLGDPLEPNDTDIIADQDEVILRDNVGASHLILDDGDVVLRPGMARLRNFGDNIKYINHYNLSEFSGSNNNEAIVKDSDGILDPSDVVLITGKAIISSFAGEKYIDNNGDSELSPDEAIWRDSGSIVNKLDPDDEIVKPGYASLISMENYKYTSDAPNADFNGSQAIIIDNMPYYILDRNDIQAKDGLASVVNFRATEKFADCNGDGKYSDGEPIIYESGGNTTVINPGTLGIFPDNIRYIDSDNSGYYSAIGIPLIKTYTEAIISDNGDKELNIGFLGDTDADKVLVAGEAKIKPIGAFSSKLNPANSQINAYIDKNLNNQPDDYEVLLTDNAPIGILDQSDFVWGKILASGDTYDWSGTPIAMIDGSSLNPPDSSINAYIDSYNIGFLDNYEVLIVDNSPLGILSPNDVIMGEIKNKDTLLWSASLESGIPWRQLMVNFSSQEKFLKDKSTTTYEGQAIVNEAPGTTPNVWDTSDLMVFGGIQEMAISNNWGNIKYIDSDHSGRYSFSLATNVGECILDFDLVPPGADHVVYTEIIVTEGRAGLRQFQPKIKFCDQFIKNGIYDLNEVLIDDANNDNMIGNGEVIFAGMVGNMRLDLPLKYIDSNHDSKFSGNEAIISDGKNNNLLDAGNLDGSGVDKVISQGSAELTQFRRSEKYADANGNLTFDAGEAIIYDWYDAGTSRGEFMLAGDHVNKNGSLTYLAPNTRVRDCVIMKGEAGIIKINERANQKYIDSNGSNTYNGFYDVWSGIDYEPIIASANNQLDKGKLDGSETDTLIASGYCLSSWNNEEKWIDDNHDNIYQDNEAIIYDAFDDGFISSIGTGANDDKIIVSGNATLQDFANMKYVDANGNNDIDEGELLIKDSNQNNIAENNEICQSGIIPSLKPFTSTDYRYCDWNQNGSYDPDEESIIYTPTEPDILEKEDQIVASGSYPSLTAFGSNVCYIDASQNNAYDTDEAIIANDGDEVMEQSDMIIIPGIATSFDGTNIKYAGLGISNDYVDGRLIANSSDDILEGEEIITPGTANIKEFNPDKDLYSDSNHNGRYDYKAYNGNFGEAIISDITGNKNTIEAGEIKTDGYADLMTFYGTGFKYSDSGDRDQNYNDGELLINDLNSDDKVDPTEIVFYGTADLKPFPGNIRYCDSNDNDQYDVLEAIVMSDDEILQSTDTIMIEGKARLHMFEQNIYRFADSDHDGTYSSNEAIIIESRWGVPDDILEESDIILLAGTADIQNFPSNIMFLDDLGNSGEYEDGEAIVNDINANNLLDANDTVIRSGRASLKRFASSERYSDGGNQAENSLYESDEAIIRDGNTDGKLSAGPMDGTGTDAVISPGKAGLRRFDGSERYVDKNFNNQYDGNEDIYHDGDNSGIVTGDGNDKLIYIIVENVGTATNQDISLVRLWADRDNDGLFEPNSDDSPALASLTPDSLKTKIWYAGPAVAPLLSANSAKASIDFPLSNGGQRFFVSVNIGANPADASDIQMQIPIGGVKTLYSSPVPTDSPITNSYKQIIDFSNPAFVEITSPNNDEVVYGQVALRARADDGVQIGKVEFYDGQNLIGVDENGEPWEALWDSRQAEFGEHSIYARAYDKTYTYLTGNQTLTHYLDSNPVSVIVGISYSIPLVAGWNYVSLPIEPFYNDVQFIMSSIGNNARSIWAYEAIDQKWRRYDLNGPLFLNDLMTVKSGIGYQIFMTGTGTLNIIGGLPEASIPLLDGWNFVGWNSLNIMDAAGAILPIMPNQPSIWTLDANGEWLGYEPSDPPNDLLSVKPGKAYWVHVTGNCIWNMDSQ